MADYINLSRGASAVCPCCRGTKMMANADGKGDTICWRCNGTGYARPIGNLDSEGLPPNNNKPQSVPDMYVTGRKRQ